jgi:hypothetical protein
MAEFGVDLESDENGVWLAYWPEDQEEPDMRSWSLPDDDDPPLMKMAWDPWTEDEVRETAISMMLDHIDG